MSALRFDALIAVGDSLCIDSESVGPHRGAASLLYRNLDAEWPDYRGRDLVTRDPTVRLLVFGQPGATARTTLAQQMKRVGSTDEPVLVTVTAGARDLLDNANGVKDADGLYDALTGIFEELCRRLSEAHVLIGNIPDPNSDQVQPSVLAEYNDVIASVAREQASFLVDIHSHFQGHGPAAGPDAWLNPSLDPTPEGAHQIRALFWQALMDSED